MIMRRINLLSASCAHSCLYNDAASRLYAIQYTSCFLSALFWTPYIATVTGVRPLFLLRTMAKDFHDFHLFQWISSLPQTHGIISSKNRFDFFCVWVDCSFDAFVILILYLMSWWLCMFFFNLSFFPFYSFRVFFPLFSLSYFLSFLLFLIFSSFLLYY